MTASGNEYSIPPANLRHNWAQNWILAVTQEGSSDYCNLDIRGKGGKLRSTQVTAHSVAFRVWCPVPSWESILSPAETEALQNTPV